jgi:hypothetical protein
MLVLRPYSDISSDTAFQKLVVCTPGDFADLWEVQNCSLLHRYASTALHCVRNKLTCVNCIDILRDGH